MKNLSLHYCLLNFHKSSALDLSEIVHVVKDDMIVISNTPKDFNPLCGQSRFEC